MQIEKITRYIPDVSPSRSGSSDGFGIRKVPLSLPRVRWLERDGFIPVSEEIKEIRKAKPKDINDFDLRLLDMNQKQNMRPFEIAQALRMEPSTIRSALSRAKEKVRLAKGTNE